MMSEERRQPGALEKGRAAFTRREWARAHHLLSVADGSGALGAEDLERWGTSAYLLGRDDDFVRISERAHHAYLDEEAPARAARCAFWSGLSLLFRGEMGPASGWLARASRLVEPLDVPEKGLSLLPEAERRLRERDWDGAFDTAQEAAEIGERLDDADLLACARHLQGRVLLLRGEVDAGLELLDETMVAVVAGELSPIPTGLVYCAVIEACRDAYEIGRAREWTTALGAWCALQPDMVAFSASCMVYRASILRFRGSWTEALEEARQAQRRSERYDRRPPASALYEQGEVHRLRGDLEQAEAAYREASRLGREPQPGLARLRLAQGRADTAAAAIESVLASTNDDLKRAELLLAAVEIDIAYGDLEGAERARTELESIASRFATTVLRAMAHQAHGELLIAQGRGREALPVLGAARDAWDAAEVPYATAGARLLMARACRKLGDKDGCALHLDAARATFEDLGARSDLDRLDSFAESSETGVMHGLTRRELEVLREVSRGKTTKAIAAALFVSDRTIERHLSNIFTKLGVTTRTAAAAYAYDHDLV